jgi:hypothetical protein
MTMGMRKRARKMQRRVGVSLTPQSWMDGDGMHLLLPGSRPSADTLQEMTRQYRENIRQSPLWQQMVEKFGLEKAEAMLEECRAELR